jgi:hypothetical protein
MDLQSSDSTEQESDEQELWHDWLSELNELDCRIVVISCSTNSNSNRRFMRRRLWARFTVFWPLKSSRMAMRRSATAWLLFSLMLVVVVVLVLLLMLLLEGVMVMLCCLVLKCFVIFRNEFMRRLQWEKVRVILNTETCSARLTPSPLLDTSTSTWRLRTLWSS